jgi:hypothetical protein
MRSGTVGVRPAVRPVRAAARADYTEAQLPNGRRVHRLTVHRALSRNFSKDYGARFAMYSNLRVSTWSTRD